MCAHGLFWPEGIEERSKIHPTCSACSDQECHIPLRPSSKDGSRCTGLSWIETQIVMLHLLQMDKLEPDAVCVLGVKH